VEFDFPDGYVVLPPFHPILVTNGVTGVYTTALLNLSIALDAPAFRGLVAALVIFMFILYFGNWAGTAWRISQGVALGIPQQREEEDEQARNKKERMDRYVVRNGSERASGSASGSNV
jgi:hypothetical protein